jgi:hypothetical protein
LRARAAAMGLRQVLPVQTNSRVFMRGKNQTSDGVASWSPVNADVDGGGGPVLIGDRIPELVCLLSADSSPNDGSVARRPSLIFRRSVPEGNRGPATSGSRSCSWCCPPGRGHDPVSRSPRLWNSGNSNRI